MLAWSRFCSWIAWHAPKELVYWCSIRLVAYATYGKYSHQIVPELTAMEALERWPIKKHCS